MSRSLFDIQDTYSYSLLEKQNSNSNLANVSDSTVLFETNPLVISNSSNISSSIIGIGSRSDRREAVPAPVNFNDIIQVTPINAFGLLAGETPISEDNNETGNKSLLAPLFNLFSGSEEKIKTENLVNVKMEQLKKNVVESVQEETKKQMLTVLPNDKKNMAEILAEHIASNVENKIETEPSLLSSIANIGKTITESVKSVYKEQTKSSDESAHVVANEIANTSVKNMTVTQEQVAANVMMKQPEMLAKVDTVANAIKNVMEEKSKIDISNETGKIVIKSENDNALVATINHITENILTPILMENIKPLVEIQKEESTTTEGVNSVKLNMSNTSKLLSSIQDEVSDKVAKTVIEKFMQRLPEKFNNKNRRSYVGPSNFAIYAQNGQKINFEGSIRHNMLEAFEQVATKITSENTSSEVKAAIEKASSSEVKENKIISGNANVAEVGNNMKIINVEVCTECEVKNSKLLTNTVASLVASKLLDKNVSEVEVKSTPGEVPNTTKLNVSAIVSSEEANKEVAESVMKSVNDASVAISKNKLESNKTDNKIINIVLIGLICYVVYKFMNKE